MNLRTKLSLPRQQRDVTERLLNRFRLFVVVCLFVCLLVLFILLTRGTTSDVKHRAIVTQTHFRRYRHYHVHLLVYVFSGKYAVVKQTPVLTFHTTQISFPPFLSTLLIEHKSNETPLFLKSIATAPTQQRHLTVQHGTIGVATQPFLWLCFHFNTLLSITYCVKDNLR